MRNYEEVLFPQVAKLLTEYVAEETVETIVEPGPREIVFTGTFEEVNEFYYEELWSDGLPIVPPTIEKVEEFLKYTDRSPDEVIGVYLPGNREGTVWKVAVNGVMAGCRPEYMPVLIAIAEAMADPTYQIQDAGSTPGWEALIILNGQKLADQLGFNYKEAVLRPGFQANTSIGRFYRLFCRNVPRLLPGITDKATFGQPFRPVLPENEEAVAAIGWEPLSVQRGFKAGDNVVTVVSIRAMSDPEASTGEAAEQHLNLIANWVTRVLDPYEIENRKDRTNVLIIGPVVASIIAKGGYSKDDVKRYLNENAVISARDFEYRLKIRNYGWSDLCEKVEKGDLPERWCESTDPERLVPVSLPSVDWLTVVSGDPARNRWIVCRDNAKQGWATSKEIELPANWDELMTELGK